ncbi:MAG: hypothetical protein PT934_06380 [Peptoniphilaceae bacterium]|uniref:hypothetical protein n=1 Tax=Parvimonas sp. TaxID=1944660 RepID=UPI002A751AF7|nr:hypothetical protein [Parvimonas sp.]MDD7765379.1 hypothetical protein [Peptoniphilaceae bacterium]MDY3051272.1 hypothetical protein [Parvimonas sp.]
MKIKMLKKFFSFVLSLTIIFGSLSLNSFTNAEEIVRINEISKTANIPTPPFKGGEHEFEITGENLEKATLEAVLTNVDTKEITTKSVTVKETTRTKQIVTVNFDKTEKKQKFTVSFRVIGDTNPDVIPYLPTVTVFSSENTGGSGGTGTPVTPTGDPTLTDVKYEVDKTSKNIFTFTLTGTNLDASKINLKFLTFNAEYGVNMVTGDVTQEPAVVNNDKTTAVVKATFPKNNTDTPIKYTVKFSVEGMYGHSQNKKFDKEIEVIKDSNNEPDEATLKNVEYQKIDNLNHNFKITGTNLSKENISFRVRLGKTTDKNALSKQILEISEDKTTAILQLTFKPLDFKTDYTIQFKLNTESSDWNFDKKVTIEKSNDEPVNPNTEDPAFPTSTLTSVEYTGRNSDNLDMFTLKGTNLKSENIKVKVMQDIERKFDIEKTLDTITTLDKISYPSLKFPENTTAKDITYKVYFNSDGSDTFEEKNSVNVIVKTNSTVNPEEPKEPEDNKKITSIKANNPVLGKDGGDAKITVLGENLSSDLTVKVYKLENGQEIEQNFEKEIVGTEKAQAITIKLPKVSKEDAIDTYKIKVGFDENKLTHEATVEVGGNASLEKIELHPQIVAVDKTGKKITLIFDEEISLVSTLEKLKEGISISLSDGTENTSTDPNSSTSHVANHGDFKPLKEKDSVEINNSSIIIKLDEAIKVGPSTKVKFQDRLIKTTVLGKNGKEEEKEGNTFTALVKEFQPIVLDGQFLEGEILQNKGGKVTVKLTGDSLDLTKEDKTKLVQVVVERAENQNNPNRLIIKPNVEYKSDSEILVTFEVPENNTKNSESYMVRVSTDAGFKYTSEVGANTSDKRFRRLITTVLPKDTTEKTPTLSYISIQSYGTSGGTDKLPDTTHTNLPTIQESKKTRLHVYGSNLDEKVTKIKIVDENGVEWYPIKGEGASDSLDNFITVAFNGTGIAGNGTFQKIEIICPRNVKGNRTYKYLLAVDGVNYNQEIFVTATVLDDGIDKKNELTAVNVVVEHKDTDGNDIVKSKVKKGYSWSKFKSFGIKDLELKNYKILGYKLTKNSETSELIDINQLFEAYVKNNEKITFIYEKIQEPDNPDKPDNPIDPNVPNNPENKKDFILDNTKSSKVEGEKLKELDTENLILVIEKLSEKIKNLDADVLDIFLKNIKTNETIKLPNGKYKVTLPKRQGQTVKAVYFLNEQENLESHSFIQDENTVTFETNHFSKYVIEYKVAENSNKTDNTSNKPNDTDKNKTEINKNENTTNNSNDNDIANNSTNNSNHTVVKVRKTTEVKQKLVKTNLATTSLFVTSLLGLGAVLSLKKRK